MTVTLLSCLSVIDVFYKFLFVIFYYNFDLELIIYFFNSHGQDDTRFNDCNIIIYITLSLDILC